MKKILVMVLFVFFMHVQMVYAQHKEQINLKNIAFHVIYLQENGTGKYKSIGTDIWEADKSRKKKKTIVEIYVLDGQVVQISNMPNCNVQ